MDIILPLLTLALGAFLGLLTSIYITHNQHRHDVTIKVVEKYFGARELLCDMLSNLASLQLTNNVDIASLPEYKKELSKLFYKYYDFLPVKVLREIVCLYACLSDRENRLFMFKEQKGKDDLLLLMTDSDIEGFIKKISVIENFESYALIPLKSKDSNMRRTASINYQARSVLQTINGYFTIQNLLSWSKHLQKSR